MHQRPGHAGLRQFLVRTTRQSREYTRRAFSTSSALILAFAGQEAARLCGNVRFRNVKRSSNLRGERRRYLPRTHLRLAGALPYYPIKAPAFNWHAHFLKGGKWRQTEPQPSKLRDGLLPSGPEQDTKSPAPCRFYPITGGILGQQHSARGLKVDPVL